MDTIKQDCLEQFLHSVSNSNAALELRNISVTQLPDQERLKYIHCKNPKMILNILPLSCALNSVQLKVSRFLVIRFCIWTHIISKANTLCDKIALESYNICRIRSPVWTVTNDMLPSTLTELWATEMPFMRNLTTAKSQQLMCLCLSNYCLPSPPPPPPQYLKQNSLCYNQAR